MEKKILNLKENVVNFISLNQWNEKKKEEEVSYVIYKLNILIRKIEKINY